MVENAGGSIAPANVTTSHGYDRRGLLTSLTDANSHTRTRAYNAAGWQTSATDRLNRTTSYAYDRADRITSPYRISEGASQPSDYGFSGEPHDAGRGLVALRARWYSPASGQFLTPDRFAGVVEQPASLQPYAYAHNNPVVFTDPSGQCIPAVCDDDGSTRRPWGVLPAGAPFPPLPWHPDDPGCVGASCVPPSCLGAACAPPFAELGATDNPLCTLPLPDILGRLICAPPPPRIPEVPPEEVPPREVPPKKVPPRDPQREKDPIEIIKEILKRLPPPVDPIIPDPDNDRGIPVFYPGNDTPLTTQHIIDAIKVLHKPKRLNRIQEPWERDWLNNHPQCPSPRPPHPVTGVRQACDEYPFASTYQGGEHNNPSLRLVPLDEQSQQGLLLGARGTGFYDRCGIKYGVRFKGDPPPGPLPPPPDSVFLVEPDLSRPTHWDCRR